MASGFCIVRKTAEEEKTSLKLFKPETWETICSAAKRRKDLLSDHFSIITEEIINTDRPENTYYHSQCLSHFCAVKRRPSPTCEQFEPPSKTTRSSSNLPSTSKRGILDQQCLFCGQKRKRKRKSHINEPLHQCITMDGSKAILLAASKKGDARILGLGDDLIAIEAKYHNTCRRDYVRLEEQEEQQMTNRKKHNEAFQKLSMFIENEIIKNETPMLATVLLSLYKEEFLAIGGTQEEIDNYTVQHLITKVKEKFEDICIHKIANKSGNIISPSSLTLTDTISLLNKSNAKAEEIRHAAMMLRTEILSMPRSKTPSPTTVHTLKEFSPNIPHLVLLFFRTLIGGLRVETEAYHSQDIIERKTVASASDAVFNCSRGTVCPWKHQLLGLGLGTLTGSKSLLCILNRFGHSISYDEVKRLETEIAYTCSDEEQDTPSGLSLCNGLATALAWDNFDVNTETLDGKNTLHSTVGICYQNKEVATEATSVSQVATLTGRMRRHFDGPVKAIPPFLMSLKQANFKLTQSCEVMELGRLKQKGLDFMWLLQSFTLNLPLFSGFFSRFTTDDLPQTVITYMDPISEPPTRNDVVQETMVRSLKVADEMNQTYAIVTYDLAVAQKAYTIQSLKAPAFDRVIILLGNFHLEMAFFGALGTYLADSGVEYLLTEVGVLAEGSIAGFMKGKFYNRCTRIHQILAAVMERALFERYLDLMPDEEASFIKKTMSGSHSTEEQYRAVLENSLFKDTMEKYEMFFHSVMDGEHGNTAAYWAIYVYFINRVYRELQRAVRTNSVDGYIEALPTVIEVFFALNRPNYARWGSLFLHKLRQMDPIAKEILEAGAMSIRRTKKSYSRCAVDLSLEQTVNRDAASPMRGISAFRNSDSAFRRWSITLTQRGMALSQLRELVGIQSGEVPENQTRKWRIQRDNADMGALTNSLSKTCNPFAIDSPAELVNVSSGKTAKEETKTFLLETLARGKNLRLKFERECLADGSRFLKRVARTKMLNFAAENMKESRTSKRRVNAAEGVRDVFGRILAIAAKTSDSLNLRHLLSYPLTAVPLSLAHSDGTPLKTDKAALTKTLEGRQDIVLTGTNLPPIKATVIDGGIILHETILQHSKSTYGTMARDLLVKVCSSRGEQIHLVLDKYQSPSIKDSERTLRCSGRHQDFIITGPDQAQRQCGTELLKKGRFKEEFACFIMKEWKKPHYGLIIGNKTLYISHGGRCIEMKNNEEQLLQIGEPDYLQGRHEEADTLIAYHVNSISTGIILVRSTDTDVLIILLGLAGRSEELSIILDYGTGNHRRYIDVSKIAATLEGKKSGLTEALIGLHALTGCDYTSCFFRKGKVKPFQRLEADAQKYTMALRSLTSEEADIPAVTSFICSLYGHKTADINEARYKSFMSMSGGNMEKNPLARIKKINCASLPPCAKTLGHHIKRAQFVARIWKRADQKDPTGEACPTDYGWKVNQNCLEPDWYPGSSVPTSLTSSFEDDEERMESTSTDEEESDHVWSEESDDSDGSNL